MLKNLVSVWEKYTAPNDKYQTKDLYWEKKDKESLQFLLLSPTPFQGLLFYPFFPFVFRKKMKEGKSRWMNEHKKMMEWRQAPFHILLGVGPVQGQWEFLDISKYSWTWMGCPHTPSKSNFSKCSKKKLLIFKLKVNSWCKNEVFLLMDISGCFQVLFYRESFQN